MSSWTVLFLTVIVAFTVVCEATVTYRHVMPHSCFHRIDCFIGWLSGTVPCCIQHTHTHTRSQLYRISRERLGVIPSYSPDTNPSTCKNWEWNIRAVCIQDLLADFSCWSKFKFVPFCDFIAQGQIQMLLSRFFFFYILHRADRWLASELTVFVFKITT